jgi:tetratricopeptide (TPR) repeat protein
VSITWKSELVTGVPCPLCLSEESKEYVLEVSVGWLPRALDLYRCPVCKCCFYPNVVPPDYVEGHSTWDVKFYCEVGAGLPFIFHPLIAVAPENPDKSLLDVGCSFGFVVDFAEKQYGWRAVGVEPSAFGRAGKEMLGVSIFNEYLQNASELSGQTFGIVFSSEVIEHIPDSEAFVRLLCNYLSRDGAVVLTTPNAEFITPAHSEVELLPGLSPGYHLHLFSEYALRSVLNKAGLPYVYVLQNGPHLVVCASRRSLGKFSTDVSGPYLDYLSAGVKRRKRDFVYDGMAYRLFRELTAKGEFEKALNLWESWGPGMRETYPNSMNPEDTTWLDSASSWEKFGATAPYFISGLFYNLGLVYLNRLKRYETASEYFRAGFAIAERFIAAHPNMAAEPATMLWRLKVDQGLCYSWSGRQKEAINCYQEILDHAEAGLSGILPGKEIIWESLFNYGIMLIQLSRFDEAAGAFRRIIAESDGVFVTESVEQLGLARSFQRNEDAQIVPESLKNRYLHLSRGSATTEAGQQHANLWSWKGLRAKLKSN